MKNFLSVFCEENWLQTSDHIITVLFGIASFVIAVMVCILAIKDKQKTIAINELKNQTKQLENIYINLISPRFINVDIPQPSIHPENKVINKGGDCLQLSISLQKCPDKQNSNPFAKFPKYFASHSEKAYFVHEIQQNSYLFEFQDILGNKIEQTLEMNDTKGVFDFTPLDKVTPK